jgi:hypothetical protein
MLTTLMSDEEKKIRRNIHIEQSLWDGLDLLRKDEPGLPSKAMMVRILIQRALEAKAAKKPS